MARKISETELIALLNSQDLDLLGIRRQTKDRVAR